MDMITVCLGLCSGVPDELTLSLSYRKLSPDQKCLELFWWWRVSVAFLMSVVMQTFSVGPTRVTENLGKYILVKPRNSE